MSETATTGTSAWKSPIVIGLLCAIILLQLGVLFQRKMQSRPEDHRITPNESRSSISRWLSGIIPWRRANNVPAAVTPDTVWDGSIRIAQMHNQINRMFEQAFHDSFRFPLAPAVASPPATSDGSAPPDPFSTMRDIRREIDGMFMAALHDMPVHSHNFDEGWADLALTPGMTVRDTGDVYEVTVALPAVDKSDIQLAMDGSILTLIVGHKESRNSEPRSAAQPAVHSQRISRFEQRLRLPGADSNPDNIKASFKNGVLRIVVPKQTEDNPSSGTIKVFE